MRLLWDAEITFDLALLFGGHPGYGLFVGSISFAGGHGTAIAWGAEASAAGLEGAVDST